MSEGPHETAAPRIMALWRCIACGNMGRLADCSGQCAFRQVSVVEAQAYADLFEAGEGAEAFLEATRPLLAKLAAGGGDADAFEAGYDDARRRAREALQGAAAAADLTDDRPAVWLCDTCGQVEAPQECLGVCVRPVREFVVAQDYDALAVTTLARVAQAKRARALLSSLAHTKPRAGRWVEAARHFSEAAAALIV